MNKPENSDYYETTMKIITLGASGAGKTSLILRLSEDSFDNQYRATIGVEFGWKKVLIGNHPIKLQLWDTAGQERFKSLLSSAYYRKTNGIIFAFDIANQESFQEVVRIYETTMQEIKGMQEEVACVLVGCKCDLEDQRAIHYDVALSFADSKAMNYFETSAKNNTNCQKAAEYLAYICYIQMGNNEIKQQQQQLIPQQQKVQKAKGCC